MAKPKNFIAGAIKHPGALRETLHAKKGEPIPLGKLKKAAAGEGVSAKTAQRARFALTLRGMNKGK